MRFFVTGGKGFIGKCLIKLLETTPTLNAVVHSYDIVDGQDIRDKRMLEKELTDFRPDVVVHLAAIPGALLCDKNPDEAVSTNVSGTYNVAKLVRDLNIPLMIHISSSSVYGGTSSEEEKIEESAPYNPSGLYGVTKCSSELVVKNVLFRKGNYAILRPFSVYGPNGRGDSVLSRWMHAAKTGGTLTFFGSGRSSRGYTFVGDIARAIAELSVKMIEKPKEYEAVVLNIGGSESVTLDFLLETFKDVVKSVDMKMPELSNKAHPSWDIIHSVADTSKAEGMFGFTTAPVFPQRVRGIIYEELYATHHEKEPQGTPE